MVTSTPGVNHRGTCGVIIIMGTVIAETHQATQQHTGGTARMWGVMMALVLLTAGLGAWKLTFASAERTAAPASAHAVGPSTETLQFRPVRSTRTGRCHSFGAASNPSAGMSVVLPAPGVEGTCLWLGSSILAVRSVTDVETGVSEAGLTYVTVTLHGGDRQRLLAQAEMHRVYAVVALGHVLSTPSGAQLVAIGGDSQFQIAGGMTASDPLPGNLAHVLRSPLVARNPMRY